MGRLRVNFGRNGYVTQRKWIQWKERNVGSREVVICANVCFTKSNTNLNKKLQLKTTRENEKKIKKIRKISKQ